MFRLNLLESFSAESGVSLFTLAVKVGNDHLSLRTPPLLLSLLRITLSLWSNDNTCRSLLGEQEGLRMSCDVISWLRQNR